MTVPLNFIQSHALRDGARTSSPTPFSSLFLWGSDCSGGGSLGGRGKRPERRGRFVSDDREARFSSSLQVVIQSSTSQSSAVRDSVRFDSFYAAVSTVDDSSSTSGRWQDTERRSSVRSLAGWESKWCRGHPEPVNGSEWRTVPGSCVSDEFPGSMDWIG